MKKEQKKKKKMEKKQLSNKQKETEFSLSLSIHPNHYDTPHHQPQNYRMIDKTLSFVFANFDPCLH